jgi:hypothetical protein
VAYNTDPAMLRRVALALRALDDWHGPRPPERPGPSYAELRRGVDAVPAERRRIAALAAELNAEDTASGRTYDSAPILAGRTRPDPRGEAQPGGGTACRKGGRYL